MTKQEWLELAKEEITKGRGDRAIKYINEALLIMTLEQIEYDSQKTKRKV